MYGSMWQCCQLRAGIVAHESLNIYYMNRECQVYQEDYVSTMSNSYFYGASRPIELEVAAKI